MKCKHCGAEIESGFLHCALCGQEVRIVPDYNPLDDVLAAHVKGGINDATRPLYNGSTEEASADREAARARRQNTKGRHHTGNTGGRRSTDAGLTKRISQEELEVRRRQAIRKKDRLRRKKRKRMLVILTMLAIAALIIFCGYKFSYTGRVNSGYNALNKKTYNTASVKFEKAISKDNTRPEAYVGLSKVYLEKDDTAAAEAVYLTALNAQTKNASLYKAAMDFYLDTKQVEKISPLIDACSDKTVLSAISAYVSKVPDYSLKESKYDDVQELKLTSKGNTIYYTIDGSDATAASTKYTEPIQLGEGATVIKSIAVNKKGIPSLLGGKTYTIELPIEDALSVTPSTGQYDQPMQITINVPEGYTAYYTTDGTDPTAESATYTEPIDMPEENTIFCAVIVNGNGKMSDITKRNYDLQISE